MEEPGWIRRRGFWPLALLWLPAGVVAQAALRFPPDAWSAALTADASLAVLAPCGLPLALGCRRLWRLGYRRGAWRTGIAFGAVTVAVTVVAGLFGPEAVAVCAAVLSLPVWAAWWWLARSRQPHRSPPGHGGRSSSC